MRNNLTNAALLLGLFWALMACSKENELEVANQSPSSLEKNFLSVRVKRWHWSRPCSETDEPLRRMVRK